MSVVGTLEELHDAAVLSDPACTLGKQLEARSVELASGVGGTQELVGGLPLAVLAQLASCGFRSFSCVLVRPCQGGLASSLQSWRCRRIASRGSTVSVRHDPGLAGPVSRPWGELVRSSCQGAGRLPEGTAPPSLQSFGRTQGRKESSSAFVKFAPVAQGP